MNKDDIIRRMEQKIRTDDHFANQVGQALDANDTAWLIQLIRDVIGIVIQIGSEIWNAVSNLFR